MKEPVLSLGRRVFDNGAKRTNGTGGGIIQTQPSSYLPVAP
jgi:hypothetical protein